MVLGQDEFGNPIQQEPNLPPAGYKREEELSRRQDQLDQQLDEKSQQSYAIDPSKMEPDREILNDLDKGFLTPPNADPNYKYAWIQCRHPVDHPSRMVETKLQERVKVNGEWIRPWKVVKGTDSDGQGLPHTAENTCTIGDVLLMRCRKDHHALLDLEHRRKSYERYYSTDSNLVEVALQYGAAAGEDAYNKYRDNANFKTKLDNALRTGTLPGVQFNRR